MADFPFMDSNLPVADRVKDLLSRMTLEEKVGQMVNQAPAIERLGIPEYDWWNEALHGVGRAGNATVFPQAIGLAATWDDDLIHRVATAISDEARAKHHQALAQDNHTIYTGLTYWSPNINILRDPRWGRAQETYGEDPYLTARMGVAFVNGLQGEDQHYLKLVATPKHFAAHSGPELGRSAFDAKVSQKDLRETYLPAFEACVKEADAKSVMGAYNRLNGSPCNANDWLLNKVLREEWGFDGFVVSDCGAIENIFHHHKTASSQAEAAAQSVKGGCDLCCGCAYCALTDAVLTGLLKEEDIDVAVGRLFEYRFRLGMFDPAEKVPYSKIPASVVFCDEHRALARETAQKSIVLLKNNGVLPLARKAKEIYVTGPTAANLEALWGNYNGMSGQMTTLLEGIVGAASVGTKVGFNPGCSLMGPAGDYTHLDWQLNHSDIIVACLGLSPTMEGEEGDAALADMGGDRRDLRLPESQRAFVKYLKSKGKPLILVLTGGSALAVQEEIELADAALLAWYPGGEGGKAVADVIFGDANPSGRLPLTFPQSTDDLPPLDDYSMDGRTYRFSRKAPLFAFGFGLSYTTFGYANPRVEPIDGFGGGAKVKVDVKNTGSVAGEEVVQVYVRDVEASTRVPLHRLAGFTRVFLSPGETKTVQVSLAKDAFYLVDDTGAKQLEPGEFEVFVGGGQPSDKSVKVVVKV
jgi:beta-glucosidase